MQAHRQVLPLKSEVISSLRSSLSTPSLSRCIEELVFNSLDAKATCIAVRVDLENYRIQVVDNGCGILSEDLALVGQRYATSKCYSLEDLNTLAFFGFRGEFLASLSNISSVLEVISRPKNTKTTFAKLFQKGDVYEVSEAKEKRPTHGTTVTAYNVFYNLPVRQKNIRVALDLERIRKRLEALAIIHHDVSLSLRDDLSGSKIFQTHTTLSPKSAFGFLFGHPKANNLKQIANSNKHFSVNGYVSTEGHANKNLQYIYVNKQLVLKTKLHKLVNYVLSRSLLLKSERSGKYIESELKSGKHPNSPLSSGKYPDSSLKSDSVSHCQQSSPSQGQGEHAIFILDIKCLRSEYDIQYDNKQTFIEFQDWKGVLACLEKALQQFLLNENLYLISKEEKDAKKKDGDDTEDSSEGSSSESEDLPTQPHPAQVAKLQKYGYNISTRNCTNNLQSRVVTRAHLKVRKKEYHVGRNTHKAGNSSVSVSALVDFEKFEENPPNLTNNSEECGLESTDLLSFSNDGDQSLICNTEEIQESEDRIEKNLLHKNEETRKTLNLKKLVDAKNKVNRGFDQSSHDKVKIPHCMDERQDRMERQKKSELHQQTAKGQLCEGSSMAEEEIDSSVVMPEMSRCSERNVEEESESVPLVMPSCASTLSAGEDNSLKMSEESLMDKQVLGKEIIPLSGDVCAIDGINNKVFDKPGQDLCEKRLEEIPHPPASKILPSVASTSGCSSSKFPVKCKPTISSLSSRSRMITASRNRVVSIANRLEPCFSLEQAGRSHQDDFKLSKEEGVQESFNCQHHEGEAVVSEEDVSMVTCEVRSDKRCLPLHVSKSMSLKSLRCSHDDNDIKKVPVRAEKIEGERSNATLQNNGGEPPREEFSQDQHTSSSQAQETSSYTSSLHRFKNGLKSHPVNVATNLASKISEALNKSKAKNAIFCTNFSDKNTTSHLSQIRSCWFPVTEDNLPVNIRDAPSIRLSQKLAWLKKCKPSEKVDGSAKMEEDTPSLEQSLVKDFYNERKPLSWIPKRGTVRGREMVRCQRRPTLGEVSSHPDQDIPHSLVSSGNSVEQMKGLDPFPKENNPPHRFQKCLSSGLSSSVGQCNGCQCVLRKDVKVPEPSTHLQNYSGHFTLEDFKNVPFDRRSIAQTRTNNLAVNIAQPHTLEINGELQEKPILEGPNSTIEITPDCRLKSHGFMSSEGFIQTARDLLTCANSSVEVDQDSVATNSSTNSVLDEVKISQGIIVNSLVYDSHQKHLDRESFVSDEERVMAKSFIAHQNSYETAVSKDEGNTSSGSVSLDDVTAISEAKHKEILSMIDNPSLLSPEIERQDGDGNCSPLICESDEELPFSRYKDIPMEEMLSTQPFHVQSDSVGEGENFRRQVETFIRSTCHKESNDQESKSSESLKMCHANSHFHINNKLSGMSELEGRKLKVITDAQSSQEQNGEHFPCDIGMNWQMFDDENSDLLTASNRSPNPPPFQTTNDDEKKLVSHRDDQPQTSDEVVPDLGSDVEFGHNDKTASSQEVACHSCVGTAVKDDSKISGRLEMSRKINLAKDHTIVLEETNSGQPLEKSTKMSKSKTQACDVEMSPEKTVRPGEHQKECKPDEENPTTERVAQPCGAKESSTTDAQNSTLMTGAKKRGSDSVPWELYWFLPKTAKPFFPRPLQDRHPQPGTAATLQSAHLLDELLSEENETANLPSKWKDGIPHLEEESCRSLDDLFDNWQNPVFKTKDADVPGCSTTRSISETVKVHNSLHPYQFTKEIFDSIEVIGQLDKKFIVCLVSTSGQRKMETKPHLLVVIDQHAAHERIRLEQLTKDACADPDDDYDAEDTRSPHLRDTIVPHLRSCRVIPPIPINLTDEECRLAQAFSRKLKRFGVTVSISKSGKGYAAEVTKLPACMVEREANMVKKARQTVAADLAEALVQESIQQLQDTAGSFASLPRTITKILNSQACRGAIKFGDPLALDDILSLLSNLSVCNLPFQCAHGRPSIIPLLDFNHLTAKLHTQDPHSHQPKINLQRFPTHNN